MYSTPKSIGIREQKTAKAIGCHKNIKKLKETGFIERAGYDRNGH